MSDSTPHWNDSPEGRINRALRETRLGGLSPKSNSRKFGRVIETLLIRELQILAQKKSDQELRFARGYVIDDYGQPESGEVSIPEKRLIEPAGPRFDIVCYHGNVAWTDYDGFPFALVPKSLADGVIEVKRTVTPKRFGPDSDYHYNEQLREHRDYIRELGIDIPRIFVAANFYGTLKENRQKGLADYVALLGDLNKERGVTTMACDGELEKVIAVLSGEDPYEMDEKTQELQDIASQITDSDDV